MRRRSTHVSSLAHIDLDKILGHETIVATVKIDPLEGRSLCCLSKTNGFRSFCYRAMTNPWFDRFVMGMISISTLLLSVESPLMDPNGSYIKTLKIIDYVMTSVFTLEMLTKMISLGIFANGSKSYLRNSWNVLDFIIVLSALLSIAFADLNLNFLKAIRMLRILRPLRLISRNKGLKLAITSLINSIPKIINLLLIVLFFMFLLAILGTTLFAGKFYNCTDLNELYGMEFNDIEGLIKTNFDCLNYGGEWVNKDFNFDTVLNSMNTLVGIQSTEGWVQVMWNSVDATEAGHVPVRNNN